MAEHGKHLVQRREFKLCTGFMLKVDLPVNRHSIIQAGNQRRPDLKLPYCSPALQKLACLNHTS